MRQKSELWPLVSRLFLVGIVAAIALAGTYALTASRIVEQERLAVLASQQAVLPEAASFTRMESEAGTSEAITVIYTGLDADAQIVGHVLSLEGKGYGGTIKLLVGLDADGKVCGVRVQSHSETAGLGAKVDNDAYLAQYIGKSDPLVLKQDIDAVTGASLSSKAVLSLVNIATDWARAWAAAH